MNRFCLFLMACLSAMAAAGQFDQATLDSLAREAYAEKDPCKKAGDLVFLARTYTTSDLNQARKISLEALDISKQNTCIRPKALAFSTLSIINQMQGKQVSAYAYADSALAVHLLIGDMRGVAAILDNKGVFYTHQGDYRSALKVQLKSLTIFEQLNDSAGMAINLTNLFGVYYALRDFENAYNTGERSLALYQKANNLDGLGRMYSNLGLIHRDNKRLDSALHYMQKGLDYFKQLNSRESIADATVNLAEIWQLKGDLDKSTELIEFAAAEYEQIGVFSKRLDIYAALIKIYEAEEKYHEGLNVADKMLQLSDSTNQLQYRRDALRLLMKLHGKVGNANKALDYAEAFIAANDSVLNQQAIIEMNRLKENDALERQQRNLASMQQKNQILALQLQRRTWMVGGLILVILLLTTIALFSVNQRKLNSERKSMQLEQSLLRSQMNPHFIFNALSAIQNFMYRSEPREAAKFLSSFARLIRAILDYSRRELIDLEEEMSWLENYLNLQSLRFENRFRYEIRCNPELLSMQLMIPPMLTQPFIENALEHGFSDIDYTGLLITEYRMNNNQLEVSITDNGKGISGDSKRNDEETPHATEITHDRIRLLNQFSRHKYAFRIESPENGGTVVRFTIPLMYK